MNELEQAKEQLKTLFGEPRPHLVVVGCGLGMSAFAESIAERLVRENIILIDEPIGFKHHFPIEEDECLELSIEKMVQLERGINIHKYENPIIPQFQGFQNETRRERRERERRKRR